MWNSLGFFGQQEALIWRKVICLWSPSLVQPGLMPCGPSATICIPWPTALLHFTGIPHWRNQTAVTEEKKRTWHSPLTRLFDHPTIPPDPLLKTHIKNKNQRKSNLTACRECVKWFAQVETTASGFEAFLWASCSSCDCNADLYLCFCHVFPFFFLLLEPVWFLHLNSYISELPSLSLF